MNDVCAFTAVCEEDTNWIPQYLAEVERLRVPFAVHFDRFVDEAMSAHPLCVGRTMQPNPCIEFDERDKQGMLELVQRRGFGWALAWDIDETWERAAPQKLQELGRLNSLADHVRCIWMNLWGDRHHVRVDEPFWGRRVKFLNLRNGVHWKFHNSTVNGPGAFDNRGERVNEAKDLRLTDLDLICLHHGMMTRELRLLHKARWDRIYSAANNGDGNPYGFWRLACDESVEPVLEEWKR